MVRPETVLNDHCRRTAVNTFSNLVGTVVVARAEGER
jgi:Na+/H+-dicarboxylate symporter